MSEQCAGTRTASSRVQAAERHVASIHGVAYSGGAMRLDGWRYPVVIDLRGLEVPETIPLLLNHENKTGSRIGLVTASNDGGSLRITGKICSGNPEAAEVVAQGRFGAAWQLSVGADVRSSVLVGKGGRMLNGQMHESPFYHVKSAVLREISVVAVGADEHTGMRVAAKFKLNPIPQKGSTLMTIKNEANEADENSGAMTQAGLRLHAAAGEAMPRGYDESGCGLYQAEEVRMECERSVAAALRRERERVAGIREIGGGEFQDLEARAIADGTSPDQFARMFLAELRGNRPHAGFAIHTHEKPEGEEKRRVIEATLALRSGIEPESLEKTYGEQTVSAGLANLGMSLKETITECLRLDGITAGRSFSNDSIRAAFSSVSLPGILSSVANKKLLQAYTAHPVAALKLCSTGDLSDFKENDRFRLTDVGDLLPVAPNGEIKDGGLIEENAKNQLETYGKKFCLTRKMILNDDLNAFMKVPAAMGNRAARLIDHLFFSRLLSNPTQADRKALFCTEHRNYFSGSNSALGADSLKKGIQFFLDQVDADGQPLNIEPRYLLVPTALKHNAIELVNGMTFIMGGGSNNVVRPAMNSLADENLKVISSPYLSNSKYTGHSSSAWYLFGDPKCVDTWEIGFYKGKRTPTIEQGETDFNSLGMWFRVYFDIGVREQDHRSMVKSAGA